MNYKSGSRNKMLQGLVFGVLFGFLLQKGGVTRYGVIMGQLLLEDFTVIKIMMTAALVGMWGIHFMKRKNLVEFRIKPFSAGATIPGGILFGIGMGILGYCPGTVSGAAAQGSLDALIGGLGGILAGSWIFSGAFPSLNRKVLHKGEMGPVRIPEVIRMNEWVVISAATILIIGAFFIFEHYGL